MACRPHHARAAASAYVGNIIVGIVGAAIAGAVLPRLELVMGGGLIGDIIYAAIGACILLFIVSLVKK